MAGPETKAGEAQREVPCTRLLPARRCGRRRSPEPGGRLLRHISRIANEASAGEVDVGRPPVGRRRSQMMARTPSFVVPAPAWRITGSWQARAGLVVYPVGDPAASRRWVALPQGRRPGWPRRSRSTRVRPHHRRQCGSRPGPPSTVRPMIASSRVLLRAHVVVQASRCGCPGWRRIWLTAVP